MFLLATFCVLILGVALVQSGTPALATPSTPEPYTVYDDAKVGAIIAHNNGSVVLLECNDVFPTRVGAYYLDATGVQRNAVPSIEDGGGSCDSGLLKASRQATTDGTLYSVEHVTSGVQSSTLIAWKNGRKLWTSDITSSTDCDPYSSKSYGQAASPLSIGADGMLYAILTPLYGTSGGCTSVPVKIDRTTGAHEPIALNTSVLNATQMWTYADRIITFHSDNTIRSYGYGGTENTSGGYPYTVDLGGPGYYITNPPEANAEGTVFVQARKSSGPAKVISYDGNVGATVMPSPTSEAFWKLIPRSDGTVRGYYGMNIPSYHTHNPSTGLWDETTLVNSFSSTFPNMNVLGIAEDTSGQLLVVRQYMSAMYDNFMVRVEVMSDDSGIPSETLFVLEHDPADPSSPNPAVLNTEIANSISGGSLYLSLCTQGICEQSGQNSLIYKIDTGSFGEVVSHTTGYAQHEDTRLEYVALGDSFSSGEGIAPFIAGTDVDDNKCHRSEDAYPMLLEEDASLNLNLTAFVACSGATTANITETGQWDEDPQIDALSEETDIVTLTIGGNNIGFTAFAERCFIDSCSTTSAIYTSTVSAINSVGGDLEGAYEAILEEIADDGHLYVLNYPMMVPMDMQYGDLKNPICPYMADGTTLGAAFGDWGDARAAQDIIARLNAAIELSVFNTRQNDSRIEYVDVSLEFEGKDICSTDSYFVNDNIPPATFHPKSEGQARLAEALSEKILPE